MNYIAAEIYPFYQMYQGVGRKPDFNEIFSLLAETGYDGFEGQLDNPGETDAYMDALKASGLSMKTGYMNLALHEKEQGQSELDRALETAEKYAPHGLEYLVVNPVPLDWNDRTLSKSDDQLTIQLGFLNRLGKALRDKGVTLSYHTHDSEMAGGAKEILHMLNKSDPRYVTWCFDGDWISQGSSHSPLAMLDWAELFGHRISIVHIRQSANTEWSQEIGPGDLDYPELVRILEEKGLNPLLVNEQIPHDLPGAFENMRSHYLKGIVQTMKWFYPLAHAAEFAGA